MAFADYNPFEKSRYYKLFVELDEATGAKLTTCDLAGTVVDTEHDLIVFPSNFRVLDIICDSHVVGSSGGFATTDKIVYAGENGKQYIVYQTVGWDYADIYVNGYFAE